MHMYKATLELELGEIQEQDKIAQLQSQYRQEQIQMQLQAECERKVQAFIADTNAKDHSIREQHVQIQSLQSELQNQQQLSVQTQT